MHEQIESQEIATLEDRLCTPLSDIQLAALDGWLREATDPYLNVPISFTFTSGGYLYATGGLNYYLLGQPNSQHLMLFARDLLGYRRCACSCGVEAQPLSMGGYTFSDPLHGDMYRRLRLAPYQDTSIPYWLEEELRALLKPLTHH